MDDDGVACMGKRKNTEDVAVPVSRQEATTSLIRRGQCRQKTWSSKDEIARKIVVF